MGDSEWSRLAGLKLTRENLQSGVKEEDSTTNVENAVFDLGVMKPLSFLFVDERIFIGLRMIRGSKTVSDTILKHDLCKLVIAEVVPRSLMMARGVLNLAKSDFMNLQTTRASLVGALSLQPISTSNRRLREENPTKKSCLGIFLSKEIFEGGMIRIHNAFVHDE
nr:hypothetical protein [Tanacetum cinerariifolium]